MKRARLHVCIIYSGLHSPVALIYFYVYVVVQFYPGSNFVFLCFKLIIIHYHTQTQRKIKFKPRMKLNHNIYI